MYAKRLPDFEAIVAPALLNRLRPIQKRLDCAQCRRDSFGFFSDEDDKKIIEVIGNFRRTNIEPFILMPGVPKQEGIILENGYEHLYELGPCVCMGVGGPDVLAGKAAQVNTISGCRKSSVLGMALLFLKEPTRFKRQIAKGGSYWP